MLLTLHQMLCFHKLRKMMFFILSISIFIFFPTKINYDIHGKTFLTIVHVFEDWYHLLAKVQYETIIYFEQIYIYIYIYVSWPLVFWINIKINWHCHYFNFGLSSHPILNIKKPNVLSHHSYFTTKKGDETYEQQCDFIFKSKHLWF